MSGCVDEISRDDVDGSRAVMTWRRWVGRCTDIKDDGGLLVIVGWKNILVGEGIYATY